MDDCTPAHAESRTRTDPNAFRCTERGPNLTTTPFLRGPRGASPQGISRPLWGARPSPSATPQHAASHSASVGKRRRAQRQYASASYLAGTPFGVFALLQWVGSRGYVLRMKIGSMLRVLIWTIAVPRGQGLREAKALCHRGAHRPALQPEHPQLCGPRDVAHGPVGHG